MEQQQATSEPKTSTSRIPTHLTDSYYAILHLHPSASAIQIRRAYRELSKRYHPDTTQLPTAIATLKFQRLNEAYAILCNPQKRSLYDLKIGYSRWSVSQPPADLNRPIKRSLSQWSDSRYLDPNDRPLSSGELFALLLLGGTVFCCLLLVFLLAFLRGDPLFPIV